MQGTSLNAYYTQVKPTLGERQKVVYDTMRTRRNWTNSELAAYLDWPINCITGRVYELRKVGLVCEDEKRICNVTKRRVIAWKIISNALF